MKDYFFLAFNNLKRRKLRSWLTMIGIFIGIAAVVALISLGQGMQNYINEEFEKLGKDKIMIQPKSFGAPGSATSPSLALTEDDLKVVQNVKGVEWAIGMVYKMGQIEFKKESQITYLIGMEPEDIKLMSEIQSFDIKDGRWFKPGDKYKVVVGYNHGYKDLWERQVEVGDTMKIEGQEFKVIGIVDKIGNQYDDAQVYAPKEVISDLLGIGNELGYVMAKTAQGYNPEDVAETIERKLRKFRDEKEDQETFSVQTSEQLLQSFQNIFGVVQAVLVGIAAISLIVGGIGIMNTMYTSVIERTKEIGTMRADGARNSDVLLIFLFESGLLGLVGGAIGIIIGIGLAKGVEYALSSSGFSGLLQAHISWGLILGALAFSFIIGTLSGVLPAMQASKLKPADALRYE